MRTALTICLVLSRYALAWGYGEMKLDVGEISDKRFGLVRHLNLDYDVSYLAERYKSREEW